MLVMAHRSPFGLSSSTGGPEYGSTRQHPQPTDASGNGKQPPRHDPGIECLDRIHLNVILSFRVSRGRDLRRLAEDGVFDETGAA
jgi:hypothetical protein